MLNAYIVPDAKLDGAKQLRHIYFTVFHTHITAMGILYTNHRKNSKPVNEKND